ncbi:MAG: adenylate/guanylate cyclase domain-containing protein [Pseudomonadota bacterium]
MQDLTPQVLVSLVCLGMALAFISADRESRTSQAMAVFLASMGISIELNIVVGIGHNVPVALTGWFAIPETVSMIAILEWILRVRRTVPARDLDTSFGDRLLRLGQGVALLYSLLSVLFPLQRNEDFLGALESPDALRDLHFWVFAGPVLFVQLCGFFAVVLLMRRRPDLPERIRILAMSAAIPFFVFAFVAPLEINGIVMIVGLMIFLLGAVQYHVMQGERGAFMSRFLSPQVAQIVRERGLKQAMQQNNLEITVVCCDIRGFTPYAQSHPSQIVIRVLREYYEAVGKIVAEYGGTIKDFAGDGILILYGAPLPIDDYGRKALAMARRIREVGRAVTQKWSDEKQTLGLGVGVASGKVTVGIIGAGARFEYTAVGPAVNLASRLCEKAADGEILVDNRTAELAGEVGLESRDPLSVKGFGEPVPLFVLQAA